MEVSDATKRAHKALDEWRISADIEQGNTIDLAYLAAFAHQEIEIATLKRQITSIEVLLENYRSLTGGKPC